MYVYAFGRVYVGVGWMRENACTEITKTMFAVLIIPRNVAKPLEVLHVVLWL